MTHSCVTDLSAAGSLTWAHFGSVNISDVFDTDTAVPDPSDWSAVTQRRQGVGPALIAGTLLHYSTSPPPKQLLTWGAKPWPSDGARFSWSDGTPQRLSGPTARSGLYSSNGTFQLTIPAPAASADGTTARKLTVFTGLFNFGATAQSTSDGIATGESYTNSATLRAASPGHEPVSHTVTHMDGNNNDAVNTRFEIVFDGALTVTWGLDPLSRLCNTALIDCGWVGLQAAALASWDGEVGGVTLRGVEIVNKEP